MSPNVISVCAIGAACLVPAARIQGGAPCIAFLDQVAFEEFNSNEGKFLKGIEDFEESNIPPASKQPLPAPLAGSIPNVDPVTGWGFPGGLLQKNLIILDNITQGPNPPRTQPSGSDIALFVIGPGFAGSNSVKVGEDLFLKGIHASLDLIFTEPNHTGIGFELSRFPGYPLAGWHITVYNKADEEIAKFFVPPPPPEPNKTFFGIWCFETIGRINIYDEAGPSPDAIDNIQMWVDEPFNPPTCPWDCGIPHNKVVDVIDLLKLLAEYDPQAPFVCDGGTCDFDANGCVDVVDLLKLLAQWNAVCPAPPNDEWFGALPIERFLADERILVHFDMYGATPSPDPYQCLPPPPVHKDIWYCLTNASHEPKHVTLRTDVPLFIEVTGSCGLPNGPLVACGPDSVKFLMFPFQQVLIRLIDSLNQPNDQLKGTLFVINNPIPPDNRLCPPDSNYSQVPHQPTEPWTFGTSDKQPGFKRYEDFAHDGRFIDQVVFWGADLHFDPQQGFVECNLQSPFFNVQFYQDDGTGHPLKADPICTYFVQATEKAFLDVYADFVNAWRYTVDLNPQCRLPAGKFWVAIQGAGGGGPNDPNDCWFLWLSSPQFNNPGSVFENTNTGEQLDVPFDLSLCIIGKVPTPSVRCGQCPPGPHWIDICPGGNDVIAPDDHSAIVGIDVNLDCIPDVNLTLVGADNLLIQKEGKYDDSLHFPGLRPIDGHLDVMDTTILSMTLTGGGVTLRVGKNQGGVIFPTHGAIAEAIADPTIGESFFDVFFEVDMGGGQLAYNQQAVRVGADITCVPPRANYRHQPGCTPLFTSPVPGQGFVVANLINANHFVFEPPPPNPFGCPQPGGCCTPHGNPGCNDTDCCRRVCTVDPFCCQVQWDSICVSEAQGFPQCGCGTCPWDLDDNGIVDGNDLAILQAHLGPCPPPCPPPCLGDFNGNCIVGGEDLNKLIANFGPCP